jgi:hypothetical protein
MNVNPEIGSLVYLSGVNPAWGPRYIPFIGSLFIVRSRRIIFNVDDEVIIELYNDPNVVWVLHTRYIEPFDSTMFPTGHGPNNQHLTQELPP